MERDSFVIWPSRKAPTTEVVVGSLIREIGVQANLKPAENLEAVAQIVSRYSNENNFKLN